MKNNNFIKTLFIVVFGTFMIACSSDDDISTSDDTSMSKKVLASYEQIIGGNTIEVDFIYNDNKELKMATSSFGDLIFELSDGRLVKTSDPFAYFEYKYNDQGYLIERLNYQDDNEDNTGVRQNSLLCSILMFIY